MQGITELDMGRDLVRRMSEEYGVVSIRESPSFIATGGVVADRVRGLLPRATRRWEFTNVEN